MKRPALEREQRLLLSERSERELLIASLQGKLALCDPVEAARIEIILANHQQRTREIETRLDIIAKVIEGQVVQPVDVLPQAPDDNLPLPPEPERPPVIANFVGREAELALYRKSLTETHLAVIVGMAGAGKTALASRLAQQVAAPDRLFWHSFHEGENVDAVIWKLAGFLAGQGQVELWRMLQGAKQVGGQTPPAELMFDYLLELIYGQGYVICLDDFHYVDQDPLLKHLAERLQTAMAGGAIHLILTSRRTPDFIRRTAVEPLAGFTVADTYQLLHVQGIKLTELLVERLHTLTGGNAQLLILALAALQNTNHPARLLDSLAETTQIEHFLLTEVDAGLNNDERGVMAAVSVLIGYAGTRDALEVVIGGGNVRRALASLVDQHLLVAYEGEGGREFGQHAIVQAFYYGSLGRTERREMHRRAGAFYESEEVDVLKAALQHDKAGDYRKAANIAASNVWMAINTGRATALRTLLTGLIAQRLPDHEAIVVRLAYSELCGFFHDTDGAQQSYDEVAARLAAIASTPAYPVLAARLCSGQGELLRHQEPMQAIDNLQVCLRHLAGQLAADVEADLWLKLGAIQADVCDNAAAQHSLEKAIELCPDRTSPVYARASLSLGVIFGNYGDLAESNRYLESSLDIHRHLHNCFGEIKILSNLAINKEIAGAWGEAERDYEAALSIARRIGSASEQARLANLLGVLYTNRGIDENAFDYFAQAIELARTRNLANYLPAFLSSLTDLYLRRGEYNQAAPCLEEALALANSTRARFPLPELSISQAILEVARGSLEKAIAWATQAESLAAEMGMALEQGKAKRILAALYAADGRSQLALQTFAESLALLEGQDPFEAARTRLDWGKLLVTLQPEEGKSLIRQAEEVFRFLGAQREIALSKSVIGE